MAPPLGAGRSTQRLEPAVPVLPPPPSPTSRSASACGTPLSPGQEGRGRLEGAIGKMQDLRRLWLEEAQYLPSCGEAVWWGVLSITQSPSLRALCFARCTPAGARGAPPSSSGQRRMVLQFLVSPWVTCTPLHPAHHPLLPAVPAQKPRTPKGTANCLFTAQQRCFKNVP